MVLIPSMKAHWILSQHNTWFWCPAWSTRWLNIQQVPRWRTGDLGFYCNNISCCYISDKNRHITAYRWRTWEVSTQKNIAFILRQYSHRSNEVSRQYFIASSFWNCKHSLDTIVNRNVTRLGDVSVRCTPRPLTFTASLCTQDITEGRRWSQTSLQGRCFSYLFNCPCICPWIAPWLQEGGGGGTAVIHVVEISSKERLMCIFQLNYIIISQRYTYWNRPPLYCYIWSPENKPTLNVTNAKTEYIHLLMLYTALILVSDRIF